MTNFDQSFASPIDVTSATSGITGRHRLVLAVLLTATFTLAVDFSILNVALPTIGADVGFSLANLQWITTCFALCAAGFTLLFGRIADLFGRKRLFLVGMAVLGDLVAHRRTSHHATGPDRGPDRPRTGHRRGHPRRVVAVDHVLPRGSPAHQGTRAERGADGSRFHHRRDPGRGAHRPAGWRWAFFINVAISAVVVVVSPRVLSESRPAQRPTLDVPGALVVTAALLSVVYGLTQAGARSWGDVQAYGSLLLGAALLLVFWVVEQRVPQPLIPIRFMRRSAIRWGNLAGLLAFATETSVVFLLTLYLQKVLGYSPLAAGLSFAVLGVGTVLGGLVGSPSHRRVREQESPRRGLRDPGGRHAAIGLPR